MRSQTRSGQDTSQFDMACVEIFNGEKAGDGSAKSEVKSMAENFKVNLDVRWSDCDPNRHLRHSSYADYATHVRLAYLEHKGFPVTRFEEEGFGAVIVREELQYLREIELHEKITVDFQVIAFSDDWCRWTVMHEFRKENGKRAAIVSIDGLWLDMKTRKMRTPPDDLRTIMESLPVGKVPAYKRFLS